ncbi:MAG: prephenate dehydrogenase/arogenate dehydrogenase family protein [Candidatus Natronoplasma sp.]
MGELLAELFSKRYEVGVYSRGTFETEFTVFDSIESLYGFSNYLVITTPAEEIKSIVEKLSKTDVSESKVIFDISTFKEDFIDEYKRLPQHLSIASAHPMFGEGIETLKDQNVIVVPVKGREQGAQQVEAFFEGFRAKVSLMDVEEHDELMKVLIGVPYFFGISYLSLVSELEDPERYGGTSFEYLSTYGKAVLNDSPAFIEDVIDHSVDTVKECVGNMEFSKDVIDRLKEKYGDEIEENYSKMYDLVREG